MGLEIVILSDVRISDFRLYYKAKVIKTVWYCTKTEI